MSHVPVYELTMGEEHREDGVAGISQADLGGPDHSTGPGFISHSVMLLNKGEVTVPWMERPRGHESSESMVGSLSLPSNDL